MQTRLLVMTALAAVATLTGCPKGHSLPGGHSIPGGGAPSVPGGLPGSSGEVDPNTCGNYAAMDGGMKLKAFLQATKDLETQTVETVKVVKHSCMMIGHELNLSDADMAGDDTKAICDKVYAELKNDMTVSLKAGASFKIKYKPAVCRVNIDAQAKAAAECEGHANADVGATCSGACHGTCDGQCSGKAGTGGTKGQCDGQCSGTCHGSCEGHADVNASAQCKASASVHASADLECTKPELDVSFDAKVVLDKSKAQLVVNAIKNGLPEALSVKAHLEPLKFAVEVWAQTAKDLKDMGPKFVNSFKDQALCIAGQLKAAVDASTHIQANINVSVSVSASASGSVGG